MSKFWLCAFVLLLSFSVEPSFAVGANFEEGVAKASIALGPSDLVSVSVETIDTPNGYAYSKAYA